MIDVDIRLRLESFELDVRFEAGDETPDEPGWHFLVQFTAARVGRELGDGAEVYGLLHDDGRGRFIVQSH